MHRVGLLSTAYLPPVSYFTVMAKYGAVSIEACENFQKQSYRTRARIASSSGTEFISVPILKGEGHKRPISEIEIDYKRDWVLSHKRALMSCYGSAPFYIYYKDDIFSVLDSRPRFLLDLNTNLTRVLAGLLGIRCEIRFTDSYVAPAAAASGVVSGVVPASSGVVHAAAAPGANDVLHTDTAFNAGATLQDNTSLNDDTVLQDDGRASIDFRYCIHPKRPLPPGFLNGGEYYQVFSDRLGFIPDLSAVDLLFNEGPNAISFLK